LRVLMIATELYPVFSGGLGRAVYEIVKELSRLGVDVTLLIPEMGWKGKLPARVIQLPFTIGFGVYDVSRETYVFDLEKKEEVERFNSVFAKFASQLNFDIVHVHDWMTVLAGIKIKRMKGVPLVLHIHSTEYDRTNNNPRPWVVDIERSGMMEADAVITTSKYMKKQLVSRYGGNPDKSFVAYNGINAEMFNRKIGGIKKPGEKIVLFVGRLTVQKGAWHLLQAAKRVVDIDPSVRFVIVGSGPDFGYLVNLAVEMGLEKNVIFTGRIPDDELIAAYRIADVFVMPSISEPFGIVALEAMVSGKPVIISKTSGVSEVIDHCFKVDFWDIDLMASRILELLHYRPLAEEMGKNGKREALKLGWDRTASEIFKVYRHVR